MTKIDFSIMNICIITMFTFTVDVFIEENTRDVSQAIYSNLLKTLSVMFLVGDSVYVVISY